MTGEILIRIEALRLPGLNEAEARRAVASFQAALEDLLESRGLPSGASPEDFARFDLGRLPAPKGGPEAIGRELARALYAKLKR